MNRQAYRKRVTTARCVAFHADAFVRVRDTRTRGRRDSDGVFGFTRDDDDQGDDVDGADDRGDGGDGGGEREDDANENDAVRADVWEESQRVRRDDDDDDDGCRGETGRGIWGRDGCCE